MRFLSGRPVSLTHVFMDDDTAMNIPAAVATVYADDGLAVATPTVTKSGTTFSAPVPALAQGCYRVKWDGSTVVDYQSFEVVGGFLFTVPEARGADPDLADAVRYPAAEIRAKREVVEREFQTVTGRSFTPRTRTVAVEVDGSDTAWTGLLDCATLLSISGPDGPLVAQDYRLQANGLLSGLSGFVDGTVLSARIDYGFRDVPDDVRRAAIVRLRYLLAAETSGIPDRAVSFVAAEGGTFSLATPGRNGYKLGIPEVDAVLNSYAFSVLSDVIGGR